MSTTSSQQPPKATAYVPVLTGHLHKKEKERRKERNERKRKLHSLKDLIKVISVVFGELVGLYVVNMSHLIQK